MYIAIMKFGDRPPFEAPLSVFNALLSQWAICEYYRQETATTKGNRVTVDGEAFSLYDNSTIYTGTAIYNGKGNPIVRIKNVRQRTVSRRAYEVI